MAKLTITSVVDEIEEWQSKYGDFMYSVVAFAGRELVKATKKDRDKALEIQGVFKENIDQPLDMVVEHAGTSKNGNAKWKFIEFGGGTESSESQGPNGQTPHLGSTPSRSTDASNLAMRASVALKAAANYGAGSGDLDFVLRIADEMDAWLAKKSGAVEASLLQGPAAPASSDGGGEGEAPAPPGSYQDRWAKKFGTSE